jgi:hypothetical protein
MALYLGGQTAETALTVVPEAVAGFFKNSKLVIFLNKNHTSSCVLNIKPMASNTVSSSGALTFMTKTFEVPKCCIKNVYGIRFDEQKFSHILSCSYWFDT